MTYIFPPLELHQISEKGSILDCRSVSDLSVESFLAKLPVGKIIIVKHLEYFLPVVDTLLLNLQITAENTPTKFIFTTTFNPYSERLYDRLKSLPLILDNVSYEKLSRADFNLRETEIFWYSLSEIQRRLLRLLLAGQTQFEPQFLPDLEYLKQTGIVIKNRVNLPLLNRFLSKNQDQKLELKNDQIFLGEENLQNKLTPAQTKILTLLLTKPLITREEIGVIVWPNGDYSNWAVDKFIQRLRLKLERFHISSKIISLKGKGLKYDV